MIVMIKNKIKQFGNFEGWCNAADSGLSEQSISNIEKPL